MYQRERERGRSLWPFLLRRPEVWTGAWAEVPGAYLSLDLEIFFYRFSGPFSSCVAALNEDSVMRFIEACAEPMFVHGKVV